MSLKTGNPDQQLASLVLTRADPEPEVKARSHNDGRSQKSDALMRLRQLFTWRRINSDSRRLLFGLSCDGGMALWPVLHPLRRYRATAVWGGVMPPHLTLDSFDKRQHLSGGLLKTPRPHTISFSYRRWLSLPHCLCLCVCVCTVCVYGVCAKVLNFAVSHWGVMQHFCLCLKMK